MQIRLLALHRSADYNPRFYPSTTTQSDIPLHCMQHYVSTSSSQDLTAGLRVAYIPL